MRVKLVPVLGYINNLNLFGGFETNAFLEDVVNEASKNLHTECQNSWNSSTFPGNRSAREKCWEFCAGILRVSLDLRKVKKGWNPRQCAVRGLT